MDRRVSGSEFHIAGPDTEKARVPNCVENELQKFMSELLKSVCPLPSYCKNRKSHHLYLCFKYWQKCHLWMVKRSYVMIQCWN